MHELRIAHIITSLDNGGAENQLVNLCIESLKYEKYKFIVIYLKGDGYWEDKLTQYGIDVYRLNSNSMVNLFALVRLIKILKKEKISILHSHLPLSELYAFYASFFIKFKFICTKHYEEIFK